MSIGKRDVENDSRTHLFETRVLQFFHLSCWLTQTVRSSVNFGRK